MGLGSKLANWSPNQLIDDEGLNNVSLFLKGLIEELSNKILSYDTPVVLTENSVIQDTGSNYNTKVSEFYLIDTDGTIITNAEEKVVTHSTPSTNPRIDIIQVSATLLGQNLQSRQIIDPVSGDISTETVATENAVDIDISVKEGIESVTPVAPIVDSGKIKIAEVYVDTTGGIATADIINVTSYFGNDNVGWTTEKHSTFIAIPYLKHRNETTLDHPDGSVTYAKIASAVWSNIVAITTQNLSVINGTDEYIKLDTTLKELLLGDSTVDVRVRGNIIFDGTSTFTDTTTVNVGADKQLLQAGITDNAQNTDGEFSVKRLDDETATDRDVSDLDSINHEITMGGTDHGIVIGDHVEITGATDSANNGEYKISGVSGAVLTYDDSFNSLNSDESTASIKLAKQINAKHKWDESKGSWVSDFIGPDGEDDVESIDHRLQYLASVGNILTKPLKLADHSKYRLYPLNKYAQASANAISSGETIPFATFYAVDSGDYGNQLTVTFVDRTSDGPLEITAETNTSLEISFEYATGATIFPTLQELRDNIGTFDANTGRNEFSFFDGYFILGSGPISSTVSINLSGGYGDVPADNKYDYLRAFINKGDPFDRSSGWNSPLRPRLPEVNGKNDDDRSFLRGVQDLESVDTNGGGYKSNDHVHTHNHQLNNHSHEYEHKHKWGNTIYYSNRRSAVFSFNDYGVNQTLLAGTYAGEAGRGGANDNTAEFQNFGDWYTTNPRNYASGQGSTVYKYTGGINSLNKQGTGTAHSNFDVTQVDQTDPSNKGDDNNLPPYKNVIYYIKY